MAGAGPIEADRRKYRRLNLTMLVRIRDGRNKVENVQTLDASKSGLGFVSRRKYEVGEQVYLTLPLPEGPKESKETPGRIVRAYQGTAGQVYGVDFGR